MVVFLLNILLLSDARKKGNKKAAKEGNILIKAYGMKTKLAAQQIHSPHSLPHITIGYIILHFSWLLTHVAKIIISCPIPIQLKHKKYNKWLYCHHLLHCLCFRLRIFLGHKRFIFATSIFNSIFFITFSLYFSAFYSKKKAQPDVPKKIILTPNQSREESKRMFFRTHCASKSMINYLSVWVCMVSLWYCEEKEAESHLN